MNPFAKIFLLFAALTAALPCRSREWKPEIRNEFSRTKPYSSPPQLTDTLENRLQCHIEFLCDDSCTGRALGSPGGANAGFYIGRSFKDCGLDVTARSYVSANGKVGRNVEAELRRPGADGWIIVTAYSDGIGDHSGQRFPGADTNASGVAAMLELAGALASGKPFTLSAGSGAAKDPGSSKWQAPLKHNVLFVAIDGHLDGLSGSTELWNSLSARGIGKKDIALLVNLDTMGSILAPPQRYWKDYLIVLGGSGYSKGLESCNSGLGLHLYWDYYGSSSFTDLFYRSVSDQRVFVEHGIPSVMFTSGITYNTNRASDVPSTISYSLLARRLELLRRWLTAF